MIVTVGFPFEQAQPVQLTMGLNGVELPVDQLAALAANSK